MDLHLDLSDSQEKAVFKLLETNAIERKNVREEHQLKREKSDRLSNDERFNHRNNRLDNQIEHKTALKKILSEEQFVKWEANTKNRMKVNKRRMAKAKNNCKKGNSQGFEKGGKNQNNNRI